SAPSWHFCVFSGRITPQYIFVGLDDEEKFSHNELHLIVGPWWKDIEACVPLVTMNGYDNENSDEDDQQGWYIEKLTWDSVDGPPGPHQNQKRIRLKFWVQVKGEHSHCMSVAYYVTAAGRELGDN